MSHCTEVPVIFETYHLSGRQNISFLRLFIHLLERCASRQATHHCQVSWGWRQTAPTLYILCTYGIRRYCNGNYNAHQPSHTLHWLLLLLVKKDAVEKQHTGKHMIQQLIDQCGPITLVVDMRELRTCLKVYFMACKRMGASEHFLILGSCMNPCTATEQDDFCVKKLH